MSLPPIKGFTLVKVKVAHNVDRERATFGQPDPIEVCERVVSSIPADVLREARRILDPAIGCCGIARAVVKRMVNELDIPFFDAILRVHGVDTDLALVKKARRLGFINTVHADFITWQPNMQFDVIIGNPPYSLPKGDNTLSKGKNLAIRFIEKSVQLLADGGYISMVTPYNFLKPVNSSRPSQRFKSMVGLDLLRVDTGTERAWFPNIGTKICTWGALKREGSGILSLNRFEWDLKEIPFIVDLNPEELEVFQRLWRRMKSGSNPVSYVHIKDGNQLPEEGWSMTERVNRRYGKEFIIPWGPEPVREKYEQIHISLTPEKAKELFSQLHVRFFVKATSIEPTVYHHLFNGLDFGPLKITKADQEIMTSYLDKP